MFTIIGGDGKEYGPVSTEQVRGWIGAGRANLDTKARAIGSEEWRRLGEFAEFSSGEEAPPVMAAAPSASFAAGAESFASPELATHGQRFAGALIDGILTGFCWLPAGLAFWTKFSDSIRAGDQPNPAMVMEAMQGVFFKALPFLLVLVLVQGTLLTLRSQSVGKLLLGTRIVRHADNARTGFVHAFLLRGTIVWAIERIPILGSLFWLVDVCFIFGDERRCVHDYIAGTKVVKI